MVVLCILEIVEDFMSLLREFEVFSAYASGASIVLVSLTGFFVFSNDFPLILQVYLMYVFLIST